MNLATITALCTILSTGIAIITLGWLMWSDNRRRKG